MNLCFSVLVSAFSELTVYDSLQIARSDIQSWEPCPKPQLWWNTGVYYKKLSVHSWSTEIQ